MTEAHYTKYFFYKLNSHSFRRGCCFTSKNRREASQRF